MQFIQLEDYLLLPFYLLVIYMFSYNRRNRRYKPGSPLYRYYIPALSLKLLGALGLGFVYQYYYPAGGDTNHYFLNAKMVSEQLGINSADYFDLVFKPIASTLELRNNLNWTGFGFGFDESNYFPIRVMAVLLIVSLDYYLPAAVILAFLSFSGIWKAYTAFVHIYPSLHKELAIAFLFIPSVFFWGSGILKDTITITALCWLFYSSYLCFILRIRILGSALILIASTFVVMIVKAYVVLAFLPSMLFWIFFQYRRNIRSYHLRVIALPLIVLVVAAGAFLIISFIGEQNQRYSVDNILTQATSFNANNMDAGSAIDIGVTADMGTSQLLKLAPLAVITTLFRPFLFEVRNPLMLLSALEGTYILYLFALVIIRAGIMEAGRTLISNPLAAFCLIFSVIFAFAIGFSTSNFGTLVRYKIPCVPFFLAGLFIILHKAQKLKHS